MNEPEFLCREVVEYLHGQSLREHGGTYGPPDEGMLESALNRPQHKWAYSDPQPDIFDLAAAYAFGLGKNHAFVDGNKRTAWAACVLFLRINHVAIAAPVHDRVVAMLGLAEGSVTEEAFAVWLRSLDPSP